MTDVVDATFCGTSVVLIGQDLKTQTRRVAKNLRVRLPSAVSSDLPEFMKPAIVIKPGAYTAEIGDGGAVFLTFSTGHQLAGHRFGVKPGEFHFVCPWIRRGETVLGDFGNGKRGWMVVPTGGPQCVRILETWRTHERPSDAVDGVLYAADNAFVRIKNTFAAAEQWVAAHDNGKHKDRWRSPRFMPRWAVRHVIMVSMARLMRLQDITKDDAIAEGVTFTDYGKHDHHLSADGGKTWGVFRSQNAGWSWGPSTHHEQCLGSPQQAFGNGWNRLHAGKNWNLKPGPAPWDQNPWVWAYTFARVA